MRQRGKRKPIYEPVTTLSTADRNPRDVYFPPCFTAALNCSVPCWLACAAAAAFFFSCSIIAGGGAFGVLAPAAVSPAAGGVADLSASAVQPVIRRIAQAAAQVIILFVIFGCLCLFLSSHKDEGRRYNYRPPCSSV